MPEKAPFKTGRIHGFSNGNAADDEEAVPHFLKRNSAKIRGLDRKTAFPTNRRKHGCKTELFPEFFVSFAAVPECRFSIPAPESHRSVALLTLYRRGFRKVISHSDGHSVLYCPSIGSQREGPKINPLNNQLGTFLPFEQKNFCKLFVNGIYNGKKSRYTAHQISGR